MLVGVNSPVQGFTSRGKTTAEAFGPGMMVWLSSAGPQDALPYPNCLHFVRLDNWGAGESGQSYIGRVAAQIGRWINVIPAAIFIPGNEPDLEAGHRGERIGEIVSAFKSAYPNGRISNVPLSVEQTKNMPVNDVDVIVCHSYFERQHPETMGDMQFGRSYQWLLRPAKPTYVTEFNVVQTNCPIDWPDRNKQAGAWLAQAAGDGVAGAALFLADASPDWASYDVGPEAAVDILAHIAPAPAPQPPPEPPKPPQPPIPPQPTPTPPTVAYSRDFDPRQYRPLDGRWLAFVSAHNPGEAQSICDSYDSGCKVTNYDPNCAIAQGCVETAVFTSPRWMDAHNAAGIGIYSDGTPDVQFNNAATGIFAQIELLSDYFGSGYKPWGILKRYGFGFSTPLGKTRLSDMDGVWAADHNYSEAIVGYLANVLGGAIIDSPTWVTGEEVVAQAMTDLGHDTFLDEGVVVPSYYRCEEAVEVWEERCGLSRLRYADARTDADSSPLNQGQAPIGARVFFRGAGWSVYDHVGTSLGDGRTISALTVVSIKDGWQDPAVGYLGWRYAPGVGPNVEPTVPAYRRMMVPMTGDGFNDAEVQRLWYGTDKPSAVQKKKFPYTKGFGIETTYGQLLNGTFKQGTQDYTGLCIPLGQCISAEESDAGTPGRSVRYFQNGKITAIKNADGSYSFKVD